MWIANRAYRYKTHPGRSPPAGERVRLVRGETPGGRSSASAAPPPSCGLRMQSSLRVIAQRIALPSLTRVDDESSSADEAAAAAARRRRGAHLATARGVGSDGGAPARRRGGGRGMCENRSCRYHAKVACRYSVARSMWLPGTGRRESGSRGQPVAALRQERRGGGAAAAVAAAAHLWRPQRRARSVAAVAGVVPARGRRAPAESRAEAAAAAAASERASGGLRVRVWGACRRAFQE